MFKKSSPNNKLTMYLNSRDLYSADSKIDRLHGVVYVDPEYLEEKKVRNELLKAHSKKITVKTSSP